MTTNRIGLEQEGRLSDERLNELIDEIVGFQSRIQASDSNNWHKKTNEILSVLRELLAYRKASKEPIAHLYGASFERGHVEGMLEDGPGCDMPVYAAPPIQDVTVPDEIVIDGNASFGMNGDMQNKSYGIGWNACRAAMLKGTTK